MKVKQIILLSFFVLFSKRIGANTYYVSPGGDDNYSQTQAQNYFSPWKTIQKAANIAVAGDTIVVTEGVYNENDIEFANAGNSNAWIVLMTESGSKPIIEGTGTCGLLIYSDIENRYAKSYYYIKGLTFRGYQVDGIRIFYSDHIFIDGIESYNNGNSGINVVSSNHIFVQDSYLHHNGWKSDGDSGWGDGLTINNRQFIETDEKWYSIVRRNFMFANFQKREDSYWDGNGMTLDLAGTGGVHLIANNVFFNNGGTGILNNNCGNIVMIHNVLFRNMADYNRNRNQGELYLVDRWVDNSILKNNIIFCRPQTAKYSYLIPIDLENTENSGKEVVENNLVWGELGSETKVCWHTYMSIQTWIHSIAPTTITGNPGFVSVPFDNDLTTYHNLEWIQMDFDDYNFNLKNDSHCIDNGTWLTETTNGGSGNTIQVKNARYFTDGFGIEKQGNVIQIGSNTPVRVTSVDYENNEIQIDSDLVWNAGDKVSLQYFGRAPDIGAYEYIPSYTPQTDGGATVPFDTTLTAEIIVGPSTSPLSGKQIPVQVILSRDITEIPTPLILTDANGTNITIDLNGNIPGNIFSGYFMLINQIETGPAIFSFYPGAFIDKNGKTGNSITKGAAIQIDKIPPNVPSDIVIE